VTARLLVLALVLIVAPPSTARTAGAGGLARGGQPVAALPERAAQPDRRAGAPISPCASEPRKWAAPEVVLLGSTVDVHLELAVTCPGQPVPFAAVLLLDRSTSMLGPPMADVQAAARRFVETADLAAGRVGIVSFASTATREARLSADRRYLFTAIDRLEARGDTNIPAALREGGRLLADGGGAAAGVLVLLSDGKNTTGADAVRQAAALQRAAGAAIWTVAIGPGADFEVMRDIASTPGDSFVVGRSHELPELYGRLAARLNDLRARDLEIRDRLPPDMLYVAGSGRPAPALEGDELVWRVPALPPDGIQLTYAVTTTVLGLRPTNVRAAAGYIDSGGRPGEAVFPVPRVEVVATLPTATATPTATPGSTPLGTTPSATPPERRTATPTGAPDATATPSPASTAGVQRAFLPAAANAACPVTGWPAEVVFVVDASTTMLGATPGGRTKIEAARAAAGRLADTLAGPAKRLAVVTFNDEARVEVALTDDPAAIRRGVAQIAIRQGSRLDRGLEAAGAHLATSGRPGVRRFAVLVSDGRPVGASAADVLDAARRLSVDAVIATIALGDDADRALLAAIAGAPERAFDGAGGDGLEAIADLVAVRVDCRRPSQ
jgi:Mg-chelatase subunit ChlD